MKTKFFLPAIAVLSLMLLSFTTEVRDDYSISQLSNGNFLLQNVPLSNGEISYIDGMVERVNLGDQLDEMGGAARGLWLFRNKKHDENRFTEKTFIGSSVMSSGILDENQQEVVNNASREISAIMERYMN